jgi:methylmalonyl-CoA mutase
MKNQLFKDFNSQSKEQWKNQVFIDLKGKDFDKTLNWIIEENIKSSSYFDRTDTEKIPLKSIQQSQFQVVTQSWSNRESINFTSEKHTNSLIISSLEAGADAVMVDFSGVSILEIEIKKLLSNIKTSDIPFFFKVENYSLNLVNELQRIAPYQWKGGIIHDILGRYFTTGFYDKYQWIETSSILRKVQDYHLFKCISISSHCFHNFGANLAQEIAFTLASAIEAIDNISEQKIGLHEIVQKIEFSISIGTNYFGEIAKIRALKFLWNKILIDGYGLDEKNIPQISIHCQTSSFYNSSLTPHTNLLRATTAAMSAVIGGCDALSIRAYDETFQESDEFSRRIARNISTILKEESYFDKVIDPSAGSYFIENMTFQIAEEALNVLQNVENQGGIIEAFQKNVIQNEIKRNFEEKQNALLKNDITMIGVNKFRFDETPFVGIENIEQPSSDLGFELLRDLRLSSVFEK